MKDNAPSEMIVMFEKIMLMTIIDGHSSDGCDAGNDYVVVD